MRNDDWRGALRLLTWLLGATALLALIGWLGAWYLLEFPPPWAAPPCSKVVCPDRYRVP